MTDRITDLLQLESKATEGPFTFHRAKFADNTGGFDYAIENSGKHIVAEFYQNVDWAQNKSFSGSLPYHSLPAASNAELFVESRNSIKEILELLVEAEKSLAFYAEGGEFTGEGALIVLDKINKFRKGE